MGVVSESFSLLTTDNTGSRIEQKERVMKAVMTEHEKMMLDIMEFTQLVVGVAEMRDVPAAVRADTILLVEKEFHKMIMNKMVKKCATASTPCNN